MDIARILNELAKVRSIKGTAISDASTLTEISHRAAQFGLKIMVAPRDTAIIEEMTPARAIVNEAQVNLSEVQSALRKFREACGMSVTELAKIRGVTAKSIFAIEDGRQSPRLSTAMKHVEAFDLALILVPRTKLASAIQAIEKHIAEHSREITERLKKLRPSGGLWYRKTNTSEEEKDIDEIASACAEKFRLPTKTFARMISTDWKTISAGGGRITAVGTMATTAKVTWALGLRLVAVPNADRATVKEKILAGLPDWPDQPLTEDSVDEFMTLLEQRPVTAGALSREKSASPETLRRRYKSISTTQTKAYAQMVRDEGFALLPVPKHLVHSILNP